MATQPKNPKDPKDREKDEILDQGLEALADQDADAKELAERKKIFAQMADMVEQPGLQSDILKRYESTGRQMLADALPSKVDPNLARSLRGILGKDVSDVRVHSGKVATEAARAMDARAFAIGDKDVFVDQGELAKGSGHRDALLAHEIAHTTDAATGYALSARSGNNVSAREQFAHEVENKFAREMVDPGDGMTRDDSAKGHHTRFDGQPSEPTVDKVLLAQKIAEILQKQDDIFSLRHGHWTGRG
ncbi:MAG: DUF4157 domain-containing protein [Myxococcota bacterium]